MIGTLPLPAHITAHQHLDIRTALADTPNATPLWAAAMATTVLRLAPDDPAYKALRAWGLKHAIDTLLAAAFPKAVFESRSFHPDALYHSYSASLTDTDPNLDHHTAKHALGILAEQWDKRLFVDPQGHPHTRTARQRFALVFSHRVQFGRGNVALHRAFPQQTPTHQPYGPL